MTRLLHTGDLQIGCGASFRADPLGEQQKIVEKINALAVARDCAAIVNGGDTFEGRGGVTPAQMDAFIRPVEQSRIPWITLTGNGVHDMAMRETNALVPLRHVPNLTIHSTPGIELVEDTYVACMPWVSVARPVAALNGDVAREDINAEAARFLLAIARGLRAEIARMAPGAPSVLALHFDIEGAGLPNGLPTDATHGVILPLAELEAVGFDVILAAHIHRPQYVIRDGGWVTPEWGGCTVTDPTAIYAGSPMTHNYGEAHTPHGVWIVDIAAGAVTAEFVPIESRPVVTFDVDLTEGDHSLEPPYTLIGTVEDAIVRLRYTATEDQARTVSQQEIRRVLLGAGAHRVDVRCTIVRTERGRAAGITETLDDLQALDLYFEARQTPDEHRAELRALGATYLEGAAT